MGLIDFNVDNVDFTFHFAPQAGSVPDLLGGDSDESTDSSTVIPDRLREQASARARQAISTRTPTSSPEASGRLLFVLGAAAGIAVWLFRRR